MLLPSVIPQYDTVSLLSLLSPPVIWWTQSYSHPLSEPYYFSQPLSLSSVLGSLNWYTLLGVCVNFTVLSFICTRKPASFDEL